MNKLIDLIQSFNYLVAFTGAGMDTESNLPDFRGPDGLWKKKDPRTIASTEALRYDYELFYEFYAHRLRTLHQVKPHRGHEILADLERRGILKSIITQNVSGLHQDAGSKVVYELHGSLKRIRCEYCKKEASEEDFFQKKRCSCRGRLRPDVVLFGESLPHETMQNALSELERADGLLIMGTSLEVQPAASLPFISSMKRIYIDLQAEDHPLIDLTYKESIGSFLEELHDHLIKHPKRKDRYDI